MSLSTLPYDIARNIVDFLDPSPAAAAPEAPSISRSRRDVGRTAALIARNFRQVGTELVWRNVVVGFHRNPDLLERILRDEWMAPLIKQLHIGVGKRDEDKAMHLDLERIFALLNRLSDCMLLVTPGVALRVLSRAALAPNVPHITNLVVDTAGSPSAAFPQQLLSAVPFFTNARRISISLRVPADSPIPPAQSTPVLRTRSVTLSTEDLKPDAYPACSSFFASYLSLFDPWYTQSLVLLSDCVPPRTIGPFFRAAVNLTTLHMYVSPADFLPLLEIVTSALPALVHLRKFKLALSSVSAQPPHLYRAHPARLAILAALAHPESHVELVALDVDLGARAEVVLALEDVSARGGRVREWRSVEWDAIMELRGEISWVRDVVDTDSGREGWVCADGEESDED
ncbi:hypothetical protein JCM3770_006819 [Rhodotorula araucariae]